jgi:hypothetical protein
MVKILVSIDDRLLAQVDRAARRQGLTRSAYLSRLAERDVGAVQGPGSLPGVQHALARLDALFEGLAVDEDATAAVRAERNAR